MSTPFDPRPRLRQLENGGTYLDVKWRLHWLRTEHPEAEIETELLSIDGDTAVCKATVRIPGGGAATGHASATATAGASSHVEQAETRAIGRALAALGYGAEFADEDLLPGRPAERPVALVPQPVSARPERTEQPNRDDAPAQMPQSQQPRVRPVRAGEPEDLQPSEDRDAPMSSPTPLTRGSELRGRPERGGPATPERAGEGEDINWNKFWAWAKRRGYRDAAHLKELLGIDVNALTPAEVRERLRRHELDNPPPGSVE